MNEAAVYLCKNQAQNIQSSAEPTLTLSLECICIISVPKGTAPSQRYTLV